MNTGLFFGTFNPVHRGHEKLVSTFLLSGILDELWIILTPTPPHKQIGSIASFQDRWNMLSLVFEDQPHLKLSDVEQRIPSPHYTRKTLSFLKNSYPNLMFYLCIGSDTLQTLSSWFEYEKIGQEAGLLVAERPGFSRVPPEELKSFSIHTCKHKKTEISATDIRRKIASGETPGADILHPEVTRYILENRIYHCE